MKYIKKFFKDPRIQRAMLQALSLGAVIVFPLFIINERFALVAQWSDANIVWKVTSIGFIVGVLYLIKIRSKLKDWIDRMEEGYPKSMLRTVFPVLLYSFVYLVARATVSRSEDLFFVLEWIIFINLFNWIFIEPWLDKVNYLCNKLQRQKEMREVLDAKEEEVK